MPPKSPSKATTASVPAIIDNPHIQDVFVDEVAGYHRCNSNLRITLTTIRADHTHDPAIIQRVVVGRLIMPLNTAEALQQGIAQFLERAKKQIAAGASTGTIQ